MFGHSYYIRKKGLGGRLFGPKTKIAEFDFLQNSDYLNLPSTIRRGMERFQATKSEKK